MAPLLIDVPPDRLPSPYREATDGRLPLGPDVEFIRQGGHMSVRSIWAVAAATGTFGVVMLASLALDIGSEPNGWRWAMWAVLLGAGLTLLLVAIRLVTAERALAAERRRNDFRRGLFLFPDALLTYLHGQDCHLLPWRDIEAVGIAAQLHGGDDLVLRIRRLQHRLLIPGTLGDLRSARSRITARLIGNPSR